jgi:hypothetical protein
MSSISIDTTIPRSDSGHCTYDSFCLATVEFIRTNLFAHRTEGFLLLPRFSSPPSFDLATAYADLLDDRFRNEIDNILRIREVLPEHLKLVTLTNPFTEVQCPALLWDDDALAAYYPTFIIESSSLPTTAPTKQLQLAEIPRCSVAELAAIISDFDEREVPRLAASMRLIIDDVKIRLFLVPTAKEIDFRSFKEQALLHAHADVLANRVIDIVNKTLAMRISSGTMDSFTIRTPTSFPIKLTTIADIHAFKDGVKLLIAVMPLAIKIDYLRKSDTAGKYITFYSYVNPGVKNALPAYYPELPKGAIPLARLLRGVRGKDGKSRTDLLPGGKSSLQILAERFTGCTINHLTTNHLQIRF